MIAGNGPASPVHGSMRLNTVPVGGAAAHWSRGDSQRSQEEASGPCHASQRSHCGNSNRPSAMAAQKRGARGCTLILIKCSIRPLRSYAPGARKLTFKAIASSMVSGVTSTVVFSLMTPVEAAASEKATAVASPGRSAIVYASASPNEK